MPEHIRANILPGTDDDIVAAYATLADRARDASFGLVEEEFVFLDTETTGLDPKKDELIEIAAVIGRGPDIVDSFQTFVDPGRPIPEEIAELTGIADADVEGAPDPDAAVAQFADFADGRDIVAHNASFDRSFIMRHVGRHTLEGSWLDSLALSRIALPRLKGHRLADLSAMFEVEIESHHRALDDVEALARIWRILLTALSDLPAGICDQIARLSPLTDWSLRPIFKQVAGLNPGKDFSLKACRNRRVRQGTLRSKADAVDVLVQAPEDETLEQAFSDTGIAGDMYEAYEPRGEQIEMAKEVADAFGGSKVCAIEAGTGVGKSLAYLVPAALIARKNEITVGVATKTNALMDQLVYHELPRLSQALVEENPDGLFSSGPLDYVALKGYEHYPCLRKLERLVLDADEERPVEEIEILAALYTYVAQSSFGDLDALNLHWQQSIRYQIEASANDCLKTKCRFYPTLCFLHGARRRANSADIVVTNHALLFRDMEADGTILPPIRHWIVDEAHGAEEEARRQLSAVISAHDLDALLQRFTASRSGIIAVIRRKADELEGASPLYAPVAEIEEQIDQITPIAESFFSYVKDLGAQAKDARGGSYQHSTLWVSPELRETAAWSILSKTGHSLASKLDELIRQMRHLVTLLEQFEDAFTVQAADIANSLSSLQDMLEALLMVLDGENENYVYAVELSSKADEVAERLSALKLDIGSSLANKFYPNALGVVYTSATLTAGGEEPFAHFEHVCGLDRLDEPARTRALPSSYDFEHRMKVFLPRGIAAPNQTGRTQELTELILEVHRALHGSVLTLFTNRQEMEEMYRTVKPVLREEGIELIAQHRSSSTKNLRERFVEDESLSLFAVKSFWEGFDAPGATLRCVIIPKLPFGRPNDPLAQERDRRESNAWSRYALPEAVMELKQAAGRLIRSTSDSGYLVLADGRLQTRAYGTVFLNALPTDNIECTDLEDICRQMREAPDGPA
ncbi:MAG: 3'-5' exoribonuclease [Coriobacteriaceae bacterium]|nr:3'-5' exoribonuclease [Coriobacteriaceae bacterium]